MRTPHWLAHHWTKWEPYDVLVRTQYYMGGVPFGELSEPHTLHREKRRCETCGKSQQRKINGADS